MKHAIDKLAPETHESVLEVIEKHNFIVIDSMEDILQLFDPKTLQNEVPTVTADSNAIIIFDNPDHNMAFLHEYFDIVIKNKDNISEILDFPQGIPAEHMATLLTKFQQKLDIIFPTVKIYYCNNRKLNEELFKPFFQSIFNNVQKNAEGTNNPILNQKFDYDCPPVILSINKAASVVMIEYEKMFPLTLQSAFGQFIIIHDGEYVKEQHNEQKAAARKVVETEHMQKVGSQPIPKDPKNKA